MTEEGNYSTKDFYDCNTGMLEIETQRKEQLVAFWVKSLAQGV